MKFKTRKIKRVLKLANECTIFIRSDTFLNCKLIEGMFREMYIATGHKRGLCIEEISQRTGLSRKSVSYSAQLLSLREKPVLKMFAWVEKTKIGTKKFQTCFILR